MCEYFVKADPILYEQRTRSIRIRGMLTSIRLENTVWDVLAEMAEDEGCTTNASSAHCTMKFWNTEARCPTSPRFYASPVCGIYVAA